MPSINMIAPRRAEKARLERDMKRLVLMILAELVLGLGLGGWVCTQYFTTRGAIDNTNRQLRKLQPIVTEIKGYEKATQTLKPKLELLNKAKDSTMLWYDALDGLTCSLAQSTFLTKVATDSTKPSGSSSTKPSGSSGAKSSASVLTLTGISSAQEQVGETMLRLQSIPNFSKVDLHYTQKTSVEDLSALEFEIGAALKSKDTAKGGGRSGSAQS